MIALFRRLFRLSRLSLHVVQGLFQASALFGFYSLSTRDQAISRWSAKLLKILGVRLIAGTPPEFTHGALLVANHISWLDIFIIYAAKGPCECPRLASGSIFPGGGQSAGG